MSRGRVSHFGNFLEAGRSLRETLSCPVGPPQRKCSKTGGRKRTQMTHKRLVAAGAGVECLEAWGTEARKNHPRKPDRMKIQSRWKWRPS